MDALRLHARLPRCGMQRKQVHPLIEMRPRKMQLLWKMLFMRPSMYALCAGALVTPTMSL